jgi:lipopolysaccharide transport system ATP-binding protein
MSSEYAITVASVSKCYEIYDKPRDRLLHLMQPSFLKRLGYTPKVRHREFWALRDISFKIERGQTVGIIGKNGSGKSTLLQLICGTLAPTDGGLRTSGRVAALLELGSGFNPEFTGRENVFLKASILGLSGEEIAARFQDIVAFADIGDFIDQPLKTYSSGMGMRLAFAVVAHVDADVLIIDEALSVGDVFFTQKCMRYLRNFISKGTVLFVSHDMGAVRGLCDRVIWLEGGKIMADGTPKEVTEGYLTSLLGSRAAAVGGTGDNSPSERRHPLQLKTPQSPGYGSNSVMLTLTQPSESMGHGGACIESTLLKDLGGNVLSSAVGGEMVRITIEARVEMDLDQVIIGFQVKDRLGQVLFGDNTFSTMLGRTVAALAGSRVRGDFVFSMPRFARGDYVISAAIASGTQDHHIVHHWVHDALAFRGSANGGVTGIMGIEMAEINLTTID